MAQPIPIMVTGTKTPAPFDAYYASAQGGKTAHTIFRRITTHDEPGPWSDPVSATVPKV